MKEEQGKGLKGNTGKILRMNINNADNIIINVEMLDDIKSEYPIPRSFCL